jgi:hypothetical protein
MMSPETTGVYECACGNTREFTGIDANGYGGPSACDAENAEGICEKGEAGLCGCDTELRQDFEVITPGPDADINYHAHTGGGCDSEIGHYTSIICRRCQAVIYTAEPIAA